MLRDIQFEAGYLRAALLVGLVHERDIPEWAEGLIAGASRFSAALSEVLLTRVELAAMREALRPIGEGVDDYLVVAALTTAVAVDPWIAHLPLQDRLRLLAHIGSEFAMTTDVSAAVRDFGDRAMLATAGVPGTQAPGDEELAVWLDAARQPGYFHFHFDDVGEAATFLAALSRKVFSDRTSIEQPAHAAAQAWFRREQAGPALALVLNEQAFRTVTREFTPVPLASRIPYPSPGDGAEEVLDEATASPLGADEARAMLAGLEGNVVDAGPGAGDAEA